MRAPNICPCCERTMHVMIALSQYECRVCGFFIRPAMLNTNEAVRAGEIWRQRISDGWTFDRNDRLLPLECVLPANTRLSDDDKWFLKEDGVEC